MPGPSLLPVLAALRRHSHGGRQELEAFRDERLRRLVAHAYARVPHYRRLFDRHGLAPHDIRGVADIAAIPITSKADLQPLPVEQVIARGANPARLLANRTSGSSGEPFVLCRTWFEQSLESLLRFRAFHYYGIRLTDRTAGIGVLHARDPNDRKIVGRALAALGLRHRQRIDGLRDPEEIVARLRIFRPDTIGGLAGVLCRIAGYLTERQMRDIRPRLVTVGGEVTTPLMRRQIADGFGAPVRDVYGSHEFSLLAWECREGGDLHTCDDGVILEVLRDDGRLAEPGERGEVVATNLHRYAMPLIRYRLGDVVTQGAAPNGTPCACGLPFATIRQVQGRMIDYFPLPDGRMLHPYDIVTQLLPGSNPWIRQYQITQERTDRVVLRIAPFGTPPAEHVTQVQRSIGHLLGPLVTLDVRLVSEIAVETTGKFRVSRSLVQSAYDDVDWGGCTFNEVTHSLLDALAAPGEARLFVHSTTSVDYAAQIVAMIPGVDRCAERALLIARPGDVVCMIGEPDADYLEYLGSLGIGPSREGIVTVPSAMGSESGSPLSERLCRDASALRLIGRALQPGRPVRLHPYVSSRHEAALASALGRATGRLIRVGGSAPRVVGRIDGKHVVRDAAVRLGVPVADGEIVELRPASDGRSHEVGPLRAAIERRAGESGRVIIRGAYGSSGSSTAIVDVGRGGLDAALVDIAGRMDNQVYLVEAMVHAIVSPNVQMYIAAPPGEIRCVGVTDQRLNDEVVHSGNVCPSRAETMTGMLSGARIMSRWLQAEGYVGLVGFDFVEYADARTGARRWLLAEINPRVNGATYPVAVLDHLQQAARRTGTPRPEAFVSGSVATSVRSFAELRDRCAGQLFDLRTGRGAVPYNVVCLEQGNCGLVVLGPSRGVVTSDYAALEAALGGSRRP